MTRMHQSRRHLLKSAAAVSAAVPFAKIGMMPSFAAEGGKKDALTGIDQVLRQAADAKEVPGVVAVGQRATECCTRAHLASATS